jgi:sn-glycerol 3-phosphate transport system substrate-binding protein
VAGYYTAPNGQMLSFPFNSSTTVFYYNKDAFKAAGLDPEKAPTTWPEVMAAADKLKASGHKCPFTTSWVSWTQLESFSAWHNTLFASQEQRLWRHLDAPGLQLAAARAPLREPGQDGQADGLFVYKGRNNTPTPPSCRANAP